MAPSKKKLWKKGRGKLGIFEPLLATWTAEAETPLGPVKCTRTFSYFHREKWIVLDADWDFGGKFYKEHAIYGADTNGNVSFWSFTSDGKRSQGTLSKAPDIHSEAIAFEAQMPAGLARMTYWPETEDTMNWAVESKSKKGWNRFAQHLYSKVEPDESR
ncbi:MAG: hypothetical protein ABI999_07530 [Acidobacteriota bacterium]